MTIDGASLTVTEVDDKDASFGIMLISHSQSILTLTNKEVRQLCCAPIRDHTDVSRSDIRSILRWMLLGNTFSDLRIGWKRWSTRWWTSD